MKDNEMRIRKDGGLSLNYKEMIKLGDMADEINMFLAEVYGVTHEVRLTSEADVDAFTLRMRNFLHHNENADYEGKMRVIFTK